MKRRTSFVGGYALLAFLWCFHWLPLGVQAIIGLVSGGLFLQPVVILIAAVIIGTVVCSGGATL